MGGSEARSGPDWSLLPHNPVAFFELSVDFERKALKRKYNQYIRQFKPEKFPVEFQRIRAAYELLDGQLRYGTTHTKENSQFQWGSQPDSARSELLQDSRPTKQSVTVPIHQRVTSESPKAIYEEFLKSTGKSPFDYFAMALISDVATEDPLMFFKLILTGLQKHPNEQGLMNLLYEYLQQDFPSKQIPGILKTVAKVINDQYFYFLTEKLWDALLRKVEFKVWANTLYACEANLKDFRIEGRIAFYLHVLPAAIFKGHPKWLMSKLDFLKKAGTDVPHEFETDVELVFQLFEYRKSLTRDEGCSKEIHQAISDYFLLGGREGDEKVIALQTSYAQNPGLLLNAYGPEQPYNDLQLAIWDYINEEVCQRHSLTSSIDPRQLRAKIFDLMDDLNRSEYATFGWKEEVQYHWTKWGIYLVVAVSPLLLLMGWVSFPIASALGFLGAVAGVLLIWFVYKPTDRYEQYIERRMRHRYFADWRGRLVHLFEATQMHHFAVTEALIDVVEHHSDKVQFASWLCNYLPGDVGLHLFASASRYLQ